MACILGTRRGFVVQESCTAGRAFGTIDRGSYVVLSASFCRWRGSEGRGAIRTRAYVPECHGHPKIERLRAFSDVEAKTFLDSDRCAFCPDSPATRSASLTAPTQPARPSFAHQNALFHATHTAIALRHTTERTPAPAPRTHFKPLACFHHSRDHRSHARSYY